MSVDFSENFMHTTAILYTDRGTSGTGFFYSVTHPEIGPSHHSMFIATNKHVIGKSKVIKTIISKADEFGRPKYDDRMVIELNLEDDDCLINHPDDSVDLCLIDITDIINALLTQGIKLYCLSFDETTIPTKEELGFFNALEDVVMVGYPRGIWDQKNNLPIMRKGVTASHISFDLDGDEWFLSDIACYRGSSGSPLFIHNDGMQIARKGHVFSRAQILLVGIAVMIPTEDAMGEMKPKEIPTTAEEEKEVEKFKTDLNLGYFIKSYKLLDFTPIIKKRCNLV